MQLLGCRSAAPRISVYQALWGINEEFVLSFYGRRNGEAEFVARESSIAGDGF